jgi:hypothetical protein
MIQLALLKWCVLLGSVLASVFRYMRSTPRRGSLAKYLPYRFTFFPASTAFLLALHTFDVQLSQNTYLLI